MPIKFPKEVTTHLFKFVNTVEIMFNRAFLFFCVFVVGWLVIVSRRCSYIIIICTHHNFVAYV